MPADRTYEAGPSRPRDKRAHKSYTKPKANKREARGDGDAADGAPAQRKQPALENRTPDGLPGLSKIKAAIRQTTRFLAKDNLEPGLRVQTQRRLESLQADLTKAEKRDVEKKNGAKYHMVKFFDRQKLARIIKREKKALKREPSATSHEETLRQARVMYNYTLHFPNAEKYISLFPHDPSSSASDTTAPTARLSLPAHLPGPADAALADLDKSTRRRLEVLREVETLMRAGKMSDEPEVAHREGHKEEKIALGGGGGGAAGAGAGKSAAEGEEAKEVSVGKTQTKSKSKKGKEEKADDDDFFE